MLGQGLSFSLPSNTGMLVTVPTGDGRATVLDFWAPTCVPCAKSLPELVASKHEIEQKGGRLVLIGVLSDDESTELAATTLKSWGVNEPFLVDRSQVAKAQLGVSILPATMVLDRTGKLIWAGPQGAQAKDVVSAVP
jgi:thiol-disulfide isomerase/thioredoxin